MRDKNPLNIIEVLKYRKKNKDWTQYQWNGLEVYLGGQRKRKNNICGKNSKKEIITIP